MPFSTVRMLKIKKKRIIWDTENHLHSVGGAIYIAILFLGNNLATDFHVCLPFNLGIMHLEIHSKEMNSQMHKIHI